MAQTPPPLHDLCETPRWVVMGVSGCGKSTVGRALAERRGAVFFDADDYHPQASVDKMASGRPLDDRDRAPWLARLNRLLIEHPGAVLACSALKKKYRDQLRDGIEAVRFVYLHADFDTLWRRVGGRENHFMPPELLQSQLDTLETPGPDEALVIDATQDLGQLLDAVAASRW